MLFDTDTLEITGMASVFDHSQALLPYAEEEDFRNMDAYLAERLTRIGEDFNEIAYGLLTPQIRSDLQNRTGFQFSRNQAYGLPEERLSVLA